MQVAEPKTKTTIYKSNWVNIDSSYAFYHNISQDNNLGGSGYLTPMNTNGIIPVRLQYKSNAKFISEQPDAKETANANLLLAMTTKRGHTAQQPCTPPLQISKQHLQRSQKKKCVKVYLVQGYAVKDQISDLIRYSHIHSTMTAKKRPAISEMFMFFPQLNGPDTSMLEQLIELCLEQPQSVSRIKLARSQPCFAVSSFQIGNGAPEDTEWRLLQDSHIQEKLTPSGSKRMVLLFALDGQVSLPVETPSEASIRKMRRQII